MPVPGGIFAMNKRLANVRELLDMKEDNIGFCILLGCASSGKKIELQ